MPRPYSRDVDSESMKEQNFSIRSFELANGRADQSDAATIGQCSTMLANLSMNSVYVSLFTTSMFEPQTSENRTQCQQCELSGVYELEPVL